MTIQETIEQVHAVRVQNEKARAEILAKIAELQGNQQVPPELTDAIAAAKASSQALDDIVPDAPPPA